MVHDHNPDCLRMFSQLETDEEINISRPRYVETAVQGRKRGSDKLGRAGKRKRNDLKVVGYWPVRIYVSKKGRARFMFARVAITPDCKVACSI